MEAYLDNSATTRCRDNVAELMVKVLCEDYGNPSSLHNKGMQGEQYLREARKTIAKTLKVKEKEIIFTSGGTESNNLAIVGSAYANQRRGKHIVTTEIEHASVTNPMKFLEEQGFEITRLPVDRDGRISLEDLEQSIREDTILVSMMHVNNEIGAVEPIEQAAKIIKMKNPECLFHVDAIQSYGKFEIYPDRDGIDFLSVSGHKIHGPKGSGFLFMHEKVKVWPEILGGGQEWGMRSGTENVPAIAGLGLAAREMYASLEENQAKLYALKKRFIEQVTQIEGVQINGRTGMDSAPQIVSVSVEGVRSEVLLHALEEKNIYVSAGSACSSNRPAISRTLKAIDLKKDLLDRTLRFSFCVFTTEEEIDYAVENMKKLIVLLRKYTRQ